MDTAGIASAIAATLAAIFAGLNLYLSNRRDRIRWVRESASDTFVEFLTASYEHRAACRLLRTAGPDDSANRQLTDLLARVDAAEEQMMKGLSRLRVLIAVPAVDAAIRLHRCNDDYYAIARGQRQANEQDTRELDRRFREERDNLVRTAQRALSLG